MRCIGIRTNLKTENMSWCYCVIKVDDCHFNSRSWITTLKLSVGNNLIAKTTHKSHIVHHGGNVVEET